MTWPQNQIPGLAGITCRDAAGAMAMVTQRVEPHTMVTAFSSGGYNRNRWHCGSGISPVAVSSRMRLDGVIQAINSMPAGGTDCSLPMRYAKDQKIEVGAFVIYTDNETWTGDIHPLQALREYRDAMGIQAKLIVVGMVSNGFTIADPDDGGSMDVVGFDNSAPAVMADFVRGDLEFKLDG
jgi:60 kDa SS-A/Ro ribonucleoprotein